MRLYNDKNPDYVRLDDDVSFQLLRTNPKLTSNTKVMYDGKNIFLESYDANPMLSTREYKGCKVLKTGLFNNDIKTFLEGTVSGAWEVGRTMEDTVMGDGFDKQFETMYWSGVEGVKSYTYPEEMGFIAPLYLRKKLPHYFVVFKMDTPANTNLTEQVADETYDFKEDVLSQARIIKTFDLREGTPIGDYIRNYTGQMNFMYDSSVYVNFGAKEIYYYGIDRSTGVLAQKVENMEEQMLGNDYTILRTDNWITAGFERNNLIFPYIINFEFLFDDNETKDYEFSRYFGMYCNDIDLQEVSVTGIGENNMMFADWSDLDIIRFTGNGAAVRYIKDKNQNLHSIDNALRIYDKVDEKDFTGYEKYTLSAVAERLDGAGSATMALRVDEPAGDSHGEYSVIITNDRFILKTYTSTEQIPERSFREFRFSSKGTVNDIADAIAGIINKYPPEGYEWLTAHAYGNVVMISSSFLGGGHNDIIRVRVTGKITKLTETFTGGTDVVGCLFKIRTEDKELFMGESGDRYIRCRNEKHNAKVLTVYPYIDDAGKVDGDYSVIATDGYGPNVRVSRSRYVELVDKFYAKAGVLSFFPVRDFDVDTVKSSYGDGFKMKEELKNVENYINANEILDSLDSSDFSTEDYTSNNILYERFIDDNNEALDTEYDYFCENLLPELCTVSKTVPFIMKWGYTDESKDSCENQYRLNSSKIFDTCNFSSNTFVSEGDIMEYTHSMPYYMVNRSGDRDVDEYQYVFNDTVFQESGDTPEKFANKWVELFTDDSVDYFDKFFGDCSASMYNSKRYNRKYSRFLNGSSIVAPSTLFRGVKFEIVEVVNGKEIKTSRYNGYKFSFVYIPYESENKKADFRSAVHFVKNDTFKFIVGMVFFTVAGIEDLPFGKGNVYAGALGFMKYDDDDLEETSSVEAPDTETPDDTESNDNE